MADTGMATTMAMESETNDVGTIDVVVIGVYFVLILMVGIWAMCKTNRSDVKGFFLAGRDITWFPVGASLFSSNIGSGHFVGLAGSGAAAGLAQGTFEWNAMVTLWILGWIFAPIYIASGVVTMPEYLKERLGGSRIRLFLSIVSLGLYIFTKISADLFSGAIFIEVALGWNLYVAMVALLAITALYTVTGGLAAVIYTDTAQTIVLLIGGLIMMGFSFDYVGGYQGLEEAYMNAIPSVRPEDTNCGLPRNDSFHVFRDPIDSDLPWPGMIFGITIISVWYWCADQVIVQRTLAAKNLSHAKGGCIMAGLIKILPMYMMIMVGMISRVRFPDTVGCADPDVCMEFCGNPTGCTNYAYAELVVDLMPVGLKGLLLAVMIAALMSSLTSVFNSASTLFTCDVWVKLRPKAKNRELMIVGRVFILVMVGVSIAWVPIIQAFSSGKLFDYIQAVTSYLGPPITAVFTMAVFWPRMNEPGAFWGMVLGMVIGLVRMIMDFSLAQPACGLPDGRPFILTKVHYLYFALILMAATIVITVIITLATPPIDDKHLVRLTWWTRFLRRKREPIPDWEEAEKRLKESLDGSSNPAFTQDDSEKADLAADNVYDSIEEQGEKSLWKKGLSLFCGLEDDNQQPMELTEEDKAELAKMTEITEERKPALLVNIGAVIMGCALCFLFGFYA